MMLRTCLERALQDRSEWLRTLALTADEFDWLVAKRVLRQENGSTSYRMEFVGVAMTSKGSIAVAPRVHGASAYSFASILHLMRRYFRRSEARAPFESRAANLHFQDDRLVREFEAYLALQSWYREHGLYRQEARATTIANGRPDWSRTLARSPPLFSDGRVLYSQPIGSRRACNPSLIGSLQLHYLKTLSSRYGFSLPSEVEAEARWTLPLAADPEAKSGAKLLMSLVQAERNSTFRGDRITLLDIMITLLGGSSGLNSNNEVRLYGTTAFYLVWEDACRHYFSADDVQQITELAQPRWQVPDDQGAWASSPGGEQRPDIAIHRGEVRALLDAKYYYPFPVAKPGWSDIVKQIYYQECLPAGSGKIINCFLMPGTGAEPFKFGGFVNVTGPHVRNFPIIEAWLLNPVLVFDAYTLGDAVQPLSFDGFLRQRADMVKASGNSPTLIDS